MHLPRLDPITRKRFQRFRRIRHGYWSLIILAVLTLLSLFAEYLANDRAILVRYNGRFYWPTWRFIPMETFGQEDEWGFSDAETDYLALRDSWRAAGADNWLIMPPIPWDPFENDFWYTEQRGEFPPNPPDFARGHYLGTDSQGRDVAARLLYGFRISMLFALALVLAGQALGTVIGSLQGYLGGVFDISSQRFIEIWSSLPTLYIIIIMATFFTPSFWMLLGIMVLFEWIHITYFMRTEMYREKAREYCLAARSYGASHARIIFRHLLPNCLTPLVTFTPFAMVGAIFALTSLDFLGYGLPPPTPSWGELLDQSLQVENRGKLWMVLSPFAALTITLILVTFVGEAVREAFDPKQYARYE
ncbi:MAG TPA: ABC transporter permease subunit [Candidatus Sumerlaeota bacterium]|nr:ABC transporter permease subunit [Candidatus Sumerlaeota bacterium]HPK03014.1 ABC transporter permease subunit [Candidatus Sumerlaeota bacterium]